MSDIEWRTELLCDWGWDEIYENMFIQWCRYYQNCEEYDRAISPYRDPRTGDAVVHHDYELHRQSNIYARAEMERHFPFRNSYTKKERKAFQEAKMNTVNIPFHGLKEIIEQHERIRRYHDMRRGHVDPKEPKDSG